MSGGHKLITNEGRRRVMINCIVHRDSLHCTTHTHTYIHTAGNILVDDTAQRIKLTNFESAEIGQQDCFHFFPVDPNVGTLYYNPPEVRDSEEY